MVKRSDFLLNVSLLIFILFSFLNAQTDPNANPNWDWRNGDDPSYQYPASRYMIYGETPQGVIFEKFVGAPWNQPNAWDALDDNEQDNGWVLVSRDFGTPTRAVIGEDVTDNPFFILYNKYKSKMRVFILAITENDYTDGGMIIEHGGEVKTCVLTHLKPRAYATDKLSIVGNNEATGLTDNVNDNRWVWADYPMAYDPTIVPTNSSTGTRLKFTVIGTTESQINVEGDLIGVSGEEKFVRNFMTGKDNGSVTVTDGVTNSAGSNTDLGDIAAGVIGSHDSWSGWKKTLDDMYKKLPQYDEGNQFKAASNIFKLNIGYLKDSWLVQNLPGIGFAVGLVDFFSGGGRKTTKEKTAPTYIGQKITLSGTINTEFKLASQATVPVPGSRIDPSIPTLGLSVPLLYNNELGLLNLTETPTIKYKTYYQYVGGGLSHQYGDFQISEDLEFAFNDLNNLGLKLDSISAWIQMDVTDVVNKTNPTTDKDLNLLASWTLQEFPKMETELLSNETFIFRTRPIDASHLKYQTIQGRITSITPDVTLKIKAVFSRLDDPDAIPIVQIITYEPELVSDGTGNWPKAPIVVKVTRKFEGGDEEVLPIEYSGQDEDLTIIMPSNIGSYIFVGWSNGSFNNSYTFENSQSVSANYKLIAHSNTATAYQNNNQRKVVKIYNGTMFRVYESLNKIWLEKSTNGGSTWVLANNNKPISNFQVGDDESSVNAEPSIATSSSGTNSYTYAVFSRKILNEPLKEIHVVRIDANGNVVDKVLCGTYNPNDIEEPVIAVYKYGRVVVVHKLLGHGLVYHIYNSALTELGMVRSIDNTDNNSVHPTLVADYYHDQFHLAWQQTQYGRFVIKYCRLEVKYNSQRLPYLDAIAYKEVSDGGMFYEENTQPSISCWYTHPTVAWVNRENGWDYSEVRVRTQSSGTYWGATKCLVDYDYYYDTDINVSVNSLYNYDDNSYMVAYVAEGDKVRYYLPYGSGTHQYVTPYNYDNYVQVCNGVESTDAVIETFKTTSSPYIFHSSLINQSLSKSNDNAVAVGGREIVITKDSTQLKLRLNTPTVNNEQIDFFEINDSTVITSKEKMISLLTTKPFELTSNSDFSFSLEYLIYKKGGNKADSNIKLDVVLLDAVSNKRIGLLKQVSSNALTNKEKNEFQYKVNTKGIGSKKVKLMISLDAKSVDKISIANTSTLNGNLKKASEIEVAFNEILGVADYALSQNYPNPFNPSTTIKYQIPNDGMVSLKIYDITGQEVKTLVNQAKAMGRYEVNFNASNLSSGVYFYRIQSGSFTKTMKMLLLK